MVKIYESLVSESLLQEFPEQTPQTLMNYAANLVGLPETLAVISVLWPRMIEDNGLVFLAETYHLHPDEYNHERFKGMDKQERQRTERVMNAISLGLFFLSEKLAVVENQKLLDTFGEALKYFWSLRLKLLFPEKTFIVEIGHNIAGEEGQVITFYQKDV